MCVVSASRQRQRFTTPCVPLHMRTRRTYFCNLKCPHAMSRVRPRRELAANIAPAEIMSSCERAICRGRRRNFHSTRAAPMCVCMQRIHRLACTREHQVRAYLRDQIAIMIDSIGARYTHNYASALHRAESVCVCVSDVVLIVRTFLFAGVWAHECTRVCANARTLILCACRSLCVMWLPAVQHRT